MELYTNNLNTNAIENITSTDFTDTIDIKDTITRINKLTSKEKMHILNILKTRNIQFTKNTNGYFFNFLNIDKTIIGKICNCLDLIEKNTDLLREMNRRRNELLKYYRLLIEDKLQNNVKKKKLEYVNNILLKQYTNINCVINRKQIIKRKTTYLNSDIDSDILMKNYIKSRYKYEKDSIYHRIITCIKLIKSNKTTNKKYEDDENDSGVLLEKESGYDNVDIDADNESINDITEAESFGIDQDIYSIDEKDDDDEKDDEKDDDDEDKFKDIIDVLLEKEECLNDDENEEADKQISNEEKTEMEFLYYKTLLNKQGFVFDENKDVILMFQEYID